MSKKKLLSEAQVRRIMGLAGINPLNEMSHYKMDDEKDPMEEAWPMHRVETGDFIYCIVS